MAIKKQTIRANQIITINGRLLTKEEIIKSSESWSEIQEIFFKKMIKQGGTFKVAGIKYTVKILERNDIDSKGNKPVNMPPIPTERMF